MSEIQPQDRLRLLRELLLEEDRREIEGLRAELAQLEAQLDEEGKKNLTDLLRDQKRGDADDYEKYVAALQGGTEGAIERSVRTNKARLAGALFPIMGPAIRSYVSEMFRSLAEDLNNTLQNATSVERIRWRFQARMPGVPFSEYVALKTANFRVEELYLMEKGTGLLIQHMAADEDHETLKGPDLMSGMLTAIRSFTRDVFGEDLDGDGETDEDQELDRFSFAGKQVLIEGSPTLVLAAVVRGAVPPPVRDKMSSVLEALHQKYTSGEGGAAHVADRLQATDEAGRREILDDALMEASSPKAEAGGGMWRAYLFLTVFGLALAAWIGWRIWDGKRWEKFADELRAQPGIEVISANGPIVVGLRDPEAIDPMTLAPAPERVELVFTPFHSLHPELVQKRGAAEQAALVDLKAKAEMAAAELVALGERAEVSQQELEKLRAELATARSDIAAAEAKRRQQVEDLLASRFANVEELQWQFDDDGVVVSGGAPEPYYSQILEQLSAIDSLGRIDSSGLLNLSGVTLEGLLKAFQQTPVIYESGTINHLAVDATVKRLAKMIGQLDEIAAENEDSYQLKKGAFTGAVSARIGRFEQADGGTLFLDEIGDMPLDVQVKMLRVLQEGTVQPVGGRGERKVDVRVIAATHRSLEKLIGEKKFREDLYYRLGAMRIELPDLAERTEDIPLLAKAIVARASADYGVAKPKLSKAVLRQLEEYAWPGNIRQFQNVHRHAVLHSGGYDLSEESIVTALAGDSELGAIPICGDPDDASSTLDQWVSVAVQWARDAGSGHAHAELVAELEQRLIRAALHLSGGHLGKVSAWLGISRVTLRKKMADYHIGSGEE